MSTINKHITLIVAAVIILANITFGSDNHEPNFADFYQSLELDTDEQAARIGQNIFNHIEKEYRADVGFGALKSKMMAADFLANQMVNQLKKATSKQISVVAGELFEDKARKKYKNIISIAPAKRFYENSRKIFSKPVSINNLKDEEKKFLVSFYDLKLRILTSAIAKAGQALTIAEPSFKGTYDYVLVLPLLHSAETRPINVNVLPKWMRQSSHLNCFSDSCLLQYGFAYHAQAFARVANELEKKDFSQEDFYISASKKCAKQLPHIAVDCLKRAIDSIDHVKTDEIMALKFDIVQVWLESDNFTLAAAAAKSITDEFPGHERSSDAVWLYFYALSRANNAEAVLSSVDTAIADPRCSDKKAKLMYIKWWALRREKSQVAQITALEHRLITEYGDDEMIAPIMLSRATDYLAKQDYSEAFVLLNQVQEKFPSTTAANQARRIVEKLKTVQGLR